MAEQESVSGPELIRWLVAECQFRKLPPTDSAMILVLREVLDIQAFMRTLPHRVEQEMKGND